jgi:hypothetical protein
MAARSVRISEASHRLLRRMAAQTGATMNAVLDAALEEHQRRLFWSRAHQEFEAMREDPTAWSEETAERDVWEAVVADGLEKE